jgi:integrase
MASIDKLGSGRWQARYRDPSNRQRKRSFARKIDAEHFLANVEADKLRGAYVDPAAGRALLADYADRWMDAQVHLRPSTRDLYVAHLRNHVLPTLGNRPLSSLRRSDMKSFVAALAATLAPSTVGTAYAVLRMIMQSAVDDELLAANPCSRVPLPRVERTIVEPLAPDAVRALINSITPRYAVAVYLAAGAGLRQGECLGLLTRRIDFLRRRIHVEQQLTGNGAAPRLAPPKTRASRRAVPVDDVVLDAVSEHLRRFPAGRDSLLVANRLGQPVRKSSFGSCWRAAVAEAGLPPGTRYHDLRHFYASTLVSAGLHPKAIQTRLGHATISETMDTYGHLFPEAEEAGRGALDAALSASGRISPATSVPAR